MRAAFFAAAALLLSGCGEVDQTMSAEQVNRADEPAFKGAHNQNVAKGWTPGTRAAWEKQVRERGQLQNEYQKTNR